MATHQHQSEVDPGAVASELRAAVAPSARAEAAAVVLGLQRTRGNRAVSRLIAESKLLQRDVTIKEVTIYGFAEGYKSKVNKPFKTADAAANTALAEISNISVEQNVEYAGNIYQRADGSFSFSAPVEGTNTDSYPSASPVPAGAKIVATYHSHAGEFKDTDELFSPTDKIKSTFSKKPGYMISPAGNQYKFIPVDQLPKDQQAANPTGLAIPMAP
jgi:hypothetical protein